MNTLLLAVELAAMDPVVTGLGGLGAGGLLVSLAKHVFSGTMKELKANTEALRQAQEQLIRLQEKLNSLAEQVAVLAGAQKAVTDLMVQVRGHDVALTSLQGDIHQIGTRLEEVLREHRAA